MQCVADEGVVVNYGGLSGEDPGIDRPSLGVRGVSLMGFMLGRGLAKRSPDAVRALYADLARQLGDRRLQAPIDSTYPIEEIREALTHAQKAGRNGKILVLPHGKL
jgi:NADPH:quinone reductase-like Zn-dependent oxidoreductase